MLGMSAGLNSAPTEWEIEMTALVGEQLSTFVKTGLPSGNLPKFNADGQYIKGMNQTVYLSFVVYKITLIHQEICRKVMLDRPKIVFETVTLHITHVDS